jgi:hypothetical protein
MPEHITHYPDDPTAWICICANEPWLSGFFPINEKDEEVEPTPEDWTTNQYCCAECGRVIDGDTLEVARQVDLDLVTLLD